MLRVLKYLRGTPCVHSTGTAACLLCVHSRRRELQDGAGPLFCSSFVPGSNHALGCAGGVGRGDPPEGLAHPTSHIPPGACSCCPLAAPTLARVPGQGQTLTIAIALRVSRAAARQQLPSWLISNHILTRKHPLVFNHGNLTFRSGASALCTQSRAVL